MGVPLSPTMASRKLQLLAYAKRYMAMYGRSPSYGEMAAELGITRNHAKRLVIQLECDGDMLRRAGARRGISFPAAGDNVSEGDALLKLRELGYDVALHIVFKPGEPGTNFTLPLIAELDHIPDVDIELGGSPDDGSAHTG